MLIMQQAVIKIDSVCTCKCAYTVMWIKKQNVFWILGDYQQNGFFWSQSTRSPAMFAPRNPPQRSFYSNRKPASVPAAFKTTSNTTSPNSSTSGSSSITPQRSHGRSTSSKGSTTSTLTPSPSPTPGKVKTLQAYQIWSLIYLDNGKGWSDSLWTGTVTFL